MKKIIFLFTISCIAHFTQAQVKIGGSGNPNSHAILELDGSTGKGLLLPRITNSQMIAMVAPDGMLIYNTTDGSLYLRKNNVWQVVAENNNNGGFSLPATQTHTADNGYVLSLTNNSFTGATGGIKGASSTSGYGIHGSSFTGIGGYFSSTTGPSLVTGTGLVGIGSAMPQAKLHVFANNQDLLHVENTNTLNPGQNARLYFKTGAFYTGGIGSTGVGSLSARMSFFSGLSGTASSLIEKMSLLENGYFGINTTSPTSRLDVNGKSTFSPGADNAAIEVKGNIKVSGATAPAFTVTYTGPDGGSKIVIDHPACNGDPAAMLFITKLSGLHMPVGVQYEAAISKWTIVTSGYYIPLTQTNLKTCGDQCSTLPFAIGDETFFVNGQKYNVLVIKQ